jgi:hypothetical protein
MNVFAAAFQFWQFWQLRRFWQSPARPLDFFTHKPTNISYNFLIRKIFSAAKGFSQVPKKKK